MQGWWQVNPANFIGQKMEAKGILVRRGMSESMWATLKAVVSTCDQ